MSQFKNRKQVWEHKAVQQLKMVVERGSRFHHRTCALPMERGPRVHAEDAGWVEFDADAGPFPWLPTILGDIVYELRRLDTLDASLTPRPYISACRICTKGFFIRTVSAIPLHDRGFCQIFPRRRVSFETSAALMCPHFVSWFPLDYHQPHFSAADIPAQMPGWPRWEHRYGPPPLLV